VTRTCTFRKLLAEFAKFADPLGIDVITGTGKATFIARLRAQPSRALTLYERCATYNDNNLQQR
jgi:hypothetical protein